jgi:choline-glycine betaine transporter
MATRRIKSNKLIIYILAAVAIVVLVVWLGDSRSFNGVMHRNNTIVVSSWNWIHILISLAIGFVLGIAFSKRK